MHFLTLLTRYFNEPFLDEFVEYYLNEGVDQIFVLYDITSTIPISQNTKSNPKITIINSHNFGGNELTDINIVYSKIKHTSEWFIFVDCDEFISTRKNANRSIRDELINTYKNVDCIKIPWIMMSCNNRQKDPPNILQSLTHRWNHDKIHPHPTGWFKGRCRYNEIEVKCIFRGNKFNNLTCHHPTNSQNNMNIKSRMSINLIKSSPIICVESVNNSITNISPVYSNLREKDISNAYLICNHYRIISYVSCVRKITDNKIHVYNKSNLQNLWLSDYSEIEDDTMKQKSIQHFGVKE